MKKQTGRSMIEMLAVLAIVGVLSIAALVGFTFAMNKHRANETIYDVMLRAANVPMIDEEYANKPIGYEFLFPGLGQNSGRQGVYYPMLTIKDGGSSYYVEVTNVTYKVCKLILQMNPTDIDQILVKDNVYNGDSNICGNENGLAMKFCFGNDGIICTYQNNEDPSSSVSSGTSSGENDPSILCDEGYTYVEGECVICTDGSACNCTSGTWNTVSGSCCEDVIEPSESACYTYEFKPASQGVCPTYSYTYLSSLCGTNGYCQNGTCTECSGDEIATETGCKCFIENNDISSVKNEHCCTEFLGIWENETCVCPENYVFNPENNQCTESDGKCWYNHDNPVGKASYYADCIISTTIPSDPGTYYADCSYENIRPLDGEHLLMRAEKACPEGFYCGIYWLSEDCESKIKLLKDDNYLENQRALYGRCMPISQPMQTSGSSDINERYKCRRNFTEVLDIEIENSCPSGFYCGVAWTKEDCSDKTSLETKEILYGRCMPISQPQQTSNSTDINERYKCRAKYTSQLDLKNGVTCAKDQYCFLNWTNSNCDTITSETAAGPIYGTCIPLNKYTAQCPY